MSTDHKLLFENILPSSTSDHLYRLEALRAAAHKIKKLDLYRYDSSQASLFVQSLPNLEEISFHYGTILEERLLASHCTLLQQLPLTSLLFEGCGSELPPSGNWRCRTTLKHFTFLDYSHSKLDLKRLYLLLADFTSLKEIKIGVATLSNELLTPFKQFPHLEKLTLATSDPRCSLAFLNLFSNSSIRILKLSITPATVFEPDLVDTALFDAISLLSPPQQIRIQYKHLPLSLPKLITYCTFNNIRLYFIKGGTHLIVPAPAPAPILVEPSQNEVILEQAFRKGLLKLSELRNDPEGIQEMFDGCEWLRATVGEMLD